ncbi:WD40 repeat domain-containing protein [Brevibacillus brevis]|uniref:WD40 repeat domain-containing protein n=1 Tax=Brevibacillus brevis TaxID=1393 RepID=UPI001643CA36|nr:WD40 repeat domain-containing protein [Brevibacillus brevis]
MLSLEDGKETEIAKFSNQIYVQDISWSTNSRYLAYLAIDRSDREKSSLGLYDMESRTSKIYELKDFAREDTPISVHVSDDGRGVLFTMFPEHNDRSGTRSILLGEMKDNKVEKQFTREFGGKQNAWISNDQFVFLGYDGTLYEYDRRNGALSVILERVSTFKLSHDTKRIAYSLNDENIIYVGKLQGRNVLSSEPVYHGIVPTNMSWSLDNKKLLIQGQSDSTEGQSFILEFE